MSLPVQILNYFATFTETRFNFRRLVNYHWTDNEYTLDLSLFPDFENSLLDQIKNGKKEDVTITKGLHSISLKKDDLIREVNILLQASCTSEKINEYVEEEFKLN